ncbi:acyl-CoA dehydrogenase [Lampropedia puyangensis]|uniref:Acyl-CoA dehydrogenase n=1 Tax=Lampropedia puyangensis TaxID=1330072 RepID=A0A4S8ES36_9BURK|nr:acyl-CoA dehydrogenase family protein [Lampropedia puyangensis]THT96294.1 acyl-CoA dehydrogenase [Lampropedia puyangensis]
MNSTPNHNSLDDDAFRHAWRSWIQANYHSPLRDPLERLTGQPARAWLQAQHRDGWRAPALPAEHGGMGLSLRKQLIYQEELERFSVARPMDMGLRLLTPVLLRYGTKEQIARFLPGILNTTEVWCQGYSEPGAGSDLANLKMRGHEQGEHLILNGQKTWTTMASDSDWIFLLVRTSQEAKRQQGITFVLADLRSPGIEIRPIRTLARDENFCEVFFDSVAVPKCQIIGQAGDGWAVGKALLGFERFSHGSPELLRHAFKVLRQTASALQILEQPHYHQVLAQHACDVADASAWYEQLCETAMQGGDAHEDFSMLKLFNAELVQRIAESATELAADAGGLLGAAPQWGLPHDLEWLYMISRPLTIFGGTAQVQRNLIATRSLALPRS